MEEVLSEFRRKWAWLTAMAAIDYPALEKSVTDALLAQRTQIIAVLEAHKADYETQRKQAGFDDTARALDAKILALDQVIKEISK